MTAHPPPPPPRLSDDPYLAPYLGALQTRHRRAAELKARLTEGRRTLPDFASAHEYYGLHRDEQGGWTFREWAPNAHAVYLVGSFNDWNEAPEFALRRLDECGTWEIRLSPGAMRHEDLYKLRVYWPGGSGERIPAYARRVIQDPATHVFSTQVWEPDEPYAWKQPDFRRPHVAPIIYEAHVGMAQEHGNTGTYDEFRLYVLPRIVAAGYNTIQLMAVLEHPYYGSFGYHVSSFFAASSRFGTPEALKALIDAAHQNGVAVIIDLVHSHAARNENEGLSRFDGTLHQYFHAGARGDHDAWDSRCFDYGKIEVLHFLLSNCRYWLDEYHVDGYRFDGITSMLYLHHGLGTGFDSYERYFDASIDEDALAYLALANEVVHAVRPDAITIAEDVSGMPGLAAPTDDLGCGFDYRLAMGIPDYWFHLFRDIQDEFWDIGMLWHELINRRRDERTISYVECHDQSIVGGKTMIFQLIDAAMYTDMSVARDNFVVERGMAIHKLARLATLASAGHGYLNFIGNEFGHPEWVDFPREGNGWSHHYARRQWHLRDDPSLKYHFLADFDAAITALAEGGELLERSQPRFLSIDGPAKLLAFERAGFFFLFNFHPTHGLDGYTIEMPVGTYLPVLSSDEHRFGGRGRVPMGPPRELRAVRSADALRYCLELTLPPRTALVLKRTFAPARIPLDGRDDPEQP